MKNNMAYPAKSNMRYFLSVLFLVAFVWSAHAQQPPILPGVPGITPPGLPSPGGQPDIILPTRVPEREVVPTQPPTAPTDGAAEKDIEAQKDDEILVKGRGGLPAARIYGQQFFRDKSISLFGPKRKVEALDSYILDANDEVSINIWGDSDYSGNFKVNNEGYLDLRSELINIPRVYLKGVTFGNAQKMLASHLGRYIDLKGPNTQIEINLNYVRSITINITGEVFNPGSFTIPATNTAFNALVAAGGPNQIGSVRDIKVFSSNKPARTLDLYAFLQDPNVRDEFFLANNDYIFVPLAERVVEVIGSVKRPFFYELSKGENLLKLIDFAGGLEADAYQNNIQIKRFINDEEVLIDVNLGEVIDNKKDFTLLDGDVVTIAPIQISYSNFVDIMGAVRIPGQYELIPDSTRLNDVLGKAGLLASARTDRMYIIRIKEDLSKEYIRLNLDTLLANPNAAANIMLRPYDLIRIEPKSKFRNDYSIGIYGAVREQGFHIYSPNLTLKDVIFLSGGLKEEAANNRIEISRIVKGRNENTRVVVQTVEIDDALSLDGDYQLEPFDQVFVRSAPEFELQRNVFIYGEVRFPGVYTIIDKNERILSLIQRAGGPTDGAFLQGSTLIRKEGKLGYVLLDASKVMADQNSNFNYILKEGDSIFIPKIKDLVTIKGFVNYPPIDSGDLQKISVPFHANKNARFYIDYYAAGVNKRKNGRYNLIFVTYPNGDIKKSRKLFFFNTFPKVQQGSIVSVEQKQPKIRVRKERQPINITQFFNSFITQTTAALTLYLLIQTAIRVAQ